MSVGVCEEAEEDVFYRLLPYLLERTRTPCRPDGNLSLGLSLSADLPPALALQAHGHAQLCTRAGDQTQVLSPTSGHSSPTPCTFSVLLHLSSVTPTV